MEQELHNLYSPDFIEDLFDEMSGSYERVNYVTSFGFAERWRWQCVAQADIQAGFVVYDLMCGMGECWAAITKNLTDTGHLIAVDISRGMCLGAERRKQKLSDFNITLYRQNILQNSVPDDSADCIISAFGLKTFSDEQKKQFAAEIERILKSGGNFSLIEVSVPNNSLLKMLYMFYLKHGPGHMKCDPLHPV